MGLPASRTASEDSPDQISSIVAFLFINFAFPLLPSGLLLFNRHVPTDRDYSTASSNTYGFVSRADRRARLVQALGFTIWILALPVTEIGCAATFIAGEVVFHHPFFCGTSPHEDTMDKSPHQAMTDLKLAIGNWYEAAVTTTLAMQMVVASFHLVVPLLIWCRGRPAARRGLFVSAYGMAAGIQLLAGISGLVLSAPYAWLPPQALKMWLHRPDQTCSNLDDLFRSMRGPSALGVIHSATYIAGLILLMGYPSRFGLQLPQKYEPITKTGPSSSPIQQPPHQLSSCGQLATHFRRQRQMLQNTTDSTTQHPNLGPNLPAPPSTAVSDLPEPSSTMSYRASLKYWGLTFPGKSRLRQTRRLDYMVLAPGFIVSTALGLPLQLSYIVVTTLLGREYCSMYCIVSSFYPILAVLWCLFSAYVVRKRITIGNEAQSPRFRLYIYAYSTISICVSLTLFGISILAVYTSMLSFLTTIEHDMHTSPRRVQAGYFLVVAIFNMAL
ncbi:hypothetical protein QBC39DRAFT_337858 [Podospora conica]|nr:hypothetical protein QBC39DRAFT_337858 [Schizothecium conicum]